MAEVDRWDFLSQLDEELLKGGVILSEWCVFIIRDADTAFTGGADLSSILTSVAAIETYLRSEYSLSNKKTLFELIQKSPIDELLRSDLHKLRKYRNKWVHVNAPTDDQALLQNPEKHEQELEEMAMFSARLLRRTMYENQCI